MNETWWQFLWNKSKQSNLETLILTQHSSRCLCGHSICPIARNSFVFNFAKKRKRHKKAFKTMKKSENVRLKWQCCRLMRDNSFWQIKTNFRSSLGIWATQLRREHNWAVPSIAETNLSMQCTWECRNQSQRCTREHWDQSWSAEARLRPVPNSVETNLSDVRVSMSAETYFNAVQKSAETNLNNIPESVETNLMAVPEISEANLYPVP